MSLSEVILLVALSCFAIPAMAENADRSKPIHLESDRVLVDDVRQVSTFEGAVKLTQGTLLIAADTLVVQQTREGFSQSTASGQLASFRQKREGTDEIVEGSAAQIKYDTRNEMVELIGQAHLKRANDEVRGDRIIYNTKTEILQVLGNPGTDANDPARGRVRAVIQPKNKTAGKP